MRGCSHERATWEASASGRWPPALSGHVNGCATCTEVRRVTEALRLSAAPLPASTDPSMLWWCARHMRRLRIVSRIERVTTLGHLAIVSAALAVAGSFVDWPSARALITWPTASAMLPWMVATPATIATAAALVWLLRWDESSVQGPRSRVLGSAEGRTQDPGPWTLDA